MRAFAWIGLNEGTCSRAHRPQLQSTVRCTGRVGPGTNCGCDCNAVASTVIRVCTLPALHEMTT